MLPFPTLGNERFRISRRRRGLAPKAIAYSLNRWDGLAHFRDDGRLCMTNNAAKRALRGIAVGRQLDLHRLRRRWPAGHRNLDPDRNRQAQRS